MANLGILAIAMLGILAYQNRDKIGDAIRGVGRGTDPNNPQGGLMDQLSKGVSGTALGDVSSFSECWRRCQGGLLGAAGPE